MDLIITLVKLCYSSFARLKDSLSFSRSDRRQQGVNLSRLDRIYVDDFFVGKGGEIGIVSGSVFSDHAPVIMVIGKQPYHNNSSDRIPKWIYLDTSLRHDILQMWKGQNTSGSENVLQMVNSTIQSTSKFLKLQVCKTMEKCKLQMAANRRALKSLQHFQEKCPHASWVEIELGHLRNELTNLEDKISQTKFHAAGAKWARLGDNVNAEFFAYYKSGHSSSCMRQLQREDGSITKDINEMREIATSFYKNLLNTQQFSVEQLQKRKIVLDCLEHKVSNEMAEALVKPISSAEVRAALVAIGKNVWPGKDGLSPDFFLEYWDDIADVFTASLQEVFKLGRMPAEWNEGMIYLIPKLEGVVDDIKKWRPITLLNTVYKVYAKLLATRLQPFLPHIVHKTQTGFIQERSIFDNIFMFWEMIAIAQ